MRLIAMRHAHSPVGSEAEDHARPLSDLGRRAAASLGQRLRAVGWRPARVLSSDAERARDTAARVAAELDLGAAQIDLRRDLYLASPAALLAALEQLPPDVDTAMVVGHNPGLEELVEQLSGCRAALAPASAALLATADADWVVAGASQWRVEAFLRA
jgi:phosphohistidine phosphatase